jgi:hypothetical protein
MFDGGLIVKYISRTNLNKNKNKNNYPLGCTMVLENI